MPWNKAPLFLVCLACLALAACSAPLHLDQDALKADAGKYNVRILRDTWGVPHIFGNTDADTAFGLAYAHAEDDFPTLQETLLATRGRIASVKGKEAAPIDFAVSLFRVEQTVNEKYEKDLSPETRALCEAYATGVNYYAVLHPKEVDAPELFPVTGKDVVAGFVQKVPFFYALNKDVEGLFGDKPAHPVSEKKAAWHSFYTRDCVVGSNAFCVAPERSADGKTRLAVNSHQPWTGPVAWYEAHLHSNQGLDIVGGTFPGAPVILHGHNRSLGWAHTVNAPDLADIYVLEMNPDNPNQYKFDGQWRDLEVSTARINVKLWGPVHWTFKRELLWSEYGPTIRQPHGVYSIRYAGMGDIRQVEQWLKMGKANNYDEWMAAVRMRALPSFNIVYGDKGGNVYYLYNALIPKRAEGYDWKQYLPGNTSETLWTEYEPFDKLPQVKNPPSGFVISCNNTPFHVTTGDGNPAPENFPSSYGIETIMTNRAFRALEIFGEEGPITRERFFACKFDTTYSKKSQAAELLTQMISSPPAGDPVVEEAKQVLREWDLTASAGNTGTAIAVLTMEPVVRAQMFGQKPPDVLQLLKEKAHLLKDKFGSIRVPWEKINHLRHGNLVLGVTGAPDTLHAVYGKWEENELVGEAGDSYILIAEWDKDGAVHSESIHQFGSATMRPDSPHYADQAPLFAQHKLKPVWLDESEIRAHLEREYRPGQS